MSEGHLLIGLLLVNIIKEKTLPEGPEHANSIITWT